MASNPHSSLRKALARHLEIQILAMFIRMVQILQPQSIFVLCYAQGYLMNLNHVGWANTGWITLISAELKGKTSTLWQFVNVAATGLFSSFQDLL